ncbi:lipopolysaccharide assembly LapA domain-containing protein [Paenibacillus sp. GCM10027627]|uniref:LapA family protein n=1 Tax=unclassified Paenibacillus TaxID=185978 RepID=UPI003635577F
MKGQGLLLSAFAFALLIAIFAVINVESVKVNFLFTETTTPLILVILVSTLLGGLTVFSFGAIRIFRLQRTVKALEKRLADGTGDPKVADSDFTVGAVKGQEKVLMEDDPAKGPF